MRQLLLCGAVIALLACGPTQPDLGDQTCRTKGCTSTERCNTTTGLCEALPSCTSDEECGVSEKCLDSVCSSCSSNIVCTAGYAACNPEKVACTGCLTHANCGGAFPLCDTADGCTGCLTNAECGGATPYCARPFCVECTSNSHCGSGLCHGGRCSVACGVDQPCATGHCVDGACAECRTTEDCAEGLACHQGVCRPPLPGDSCRNAIPIAFGGGEATVYGDASSWFKADSAQSYPVEIDVWYSVTVTEEQALNASVVVHDFFSSSADVEIRTLGDEGNPCTGRVLASEYSQVEKVFVVPDTYLVRLSSSSSSHTTGGLPNYELKVWTTPDSRALGNDCLKVKPLAVPRAGPAEFVHNDDLTGLRALPGDGCTKAAELPDLVYSFELDEPSGIEVTLTATDPTVDLAAAMSDQCGEDHAACHGFPPGPRTLYFKRPAGRQFLHVYSLAGAGPFEMKLKVVPEPKNSNCASATPVTFTADEATLEGHPRYVPEQSPGHCVASLAETVHYRISTVGMGARSLKFETLAGSPDWALHPACRAVDERATWCKELYDQTPDIAFLPEGEYVLSVTEYHGYFRLKLELGAPYPPSTNETCETALPVTLSGGTFSFSGDTRGARDDDEPQCSPRVDGGRDLFYTMPIAGKGRLTATLTAASDGYNPVLMVASDSCNFAFNGTCSNAPTLGGTESVDIPVEPWGSTSAVNFWVDGDGHTSGAFEVTGTFTPAPADDVCTRATPITVNSTVTGDLKNYFDESGSRPCTLGGGGDRWYQFNSGNNGTVTLKLTSNGFDGGVAVMKVCDYTWGETCGANAYTAPADAEDSVTISVSKNTGYLVAVYARMAGESGAYSLTLSAP